MNKKNRKHRRSDYDRQDPNLRNEGIKYRHSESKRTIDRGEIISSSSLSNDMFLAEEVMPEIISRLDHIEQRLREQPFVMLTHEQYQILIDRIEDLEDIIAFDTAKAMGEKPIPWEQALEEIEHDHPELRNARQ